VLQHALTERPRRAAFQRFFDDRRGLVALVRSIIGPACPLGAHAAEQPSHFESRIRVGARGALEFNQLWANRLDEDHADRFTNLRTGAVERTSANLGPSLHRCEPLSGRGRELACAIRLGLRSLSDMRQVLVMRRIRRRTSSRPGNGRLSSLGTRFRSAPLGCTCVVNDSLYTLYRSHGRLELDLGAISLLKRRT
jgi:hypothetical protein